jgi:16S rRNA (guanine(966)-N(2))-methyltransferase RsmD
MRIISGIYGRRLIQPPKNLPVRPTTDLAKESLFNILSNKIDFPGKSLLDLFSGTGAISYEFLSRGSFPVTSVELDFQCVKFIKETSAKLEMENHQVIRSDVFRYLKSIKRSYDIIFADPPYALNNISEINTLVFENNLLNENGYLIIEHPREIDFSDQKHFLEHRKYGKVNFSFFHYTTDLQ